jgi:hypothetical protein
MYYMSGAGLPMITGTRIDSASKHQVACRIDYERTLSWCGYDQLLMQREKLRFCMRELDMAVGCGPPIRNNEPQRTGTRNKAYPSVVVTLADMQVPAINYLIALYHNSMCMADRDKFVEDVERNIDRWVGSSCHVELAKKQIQEMPEFYMVGIAVGTAYAHPNSGDTVATVMIGGLKTILNGAFSVQCNDEIMWYWEEERACFKPDGRRHTKKIESTNGFMTSDDVTKFINGILEIDADDERRRKFFDRGNGNFAAPSRDGNVKGKQRIAYPKPFRYDDDNERIHDRQRVFAKALCSARPFEPVDIMVCRQSL